MQADRVASSPVKVIPGGTGRGLWTRSRAHEIRLVINIMNLGEVFYLTAKAKGTESAEMVVEQLATMPLEVRPAPNALVLEAARIKAGFRSPTRMRLPRRLRSGKARRWSPATRK